MNYLVPEGSPWELPALGSTVDLYINTLGRSAGRTTDETENFVPVWAFLLIMLRFARW